MENSLSIDELPKIESIYDLGEYTGYDVSYLLDMIRNQKNYYLSFKIPKNSDSKKYRKINSPTT
ncbi:hypothetical protein PT110_09175, partial [Erysipelothrix rhusiopathiae]|nr:hypothetical protein [Erysipelothrix rhusiopathiae]